MIARTEMMEPMLECCPSFRPSWQHFLEEWKEEGELPLYLSLGDLARHLVTMLAAGETSRFPEIFAVVERWHLEGDEYVREAATIGLLEDLQNTGVHDGTSPAQFEPFLQPESRKWWTKVERFWAHQETIRED